MRFSHLLVSLLLVNHLIASDFQRKLDSLLSVKQDTNVIALRMNLGEDNWVMREGYWDSIVVECEVQLSNDLLSEKENAFYTLALAVTTNNLGYILKSHGKIQEALKYYEKSIIINEATGDLQALGYGYNNIAQVYYEQGDIEKALEFNRKSLKLREKTGDKKGLATSLNNIGIIYKSQGDTSKALEFYFESLRIEREINNIPGIALSLNNIGGIFETAGDKSKALKYYQESLKLEQESGDVFSEILTINNIGTIYNDEGNYPKAIEYYQQCLELSKKNEIRGMIATSYSNLAVNFIKQSKSDKLSAARKSRLANEALAYGQKSMEVAKKLGSPSKIGGAAAALSDVYEEMQKYKQGWGMYKLYINMRDSVHNLENEKEITKMQVQYAYEKAQALKDTEHKNNLEISQEQEKKQRVISISAVVISILVFMVLIFIFNRLKITRRQKAQIEKQKHEVEQAHEMLEEKNKEVMDSIVYAQRIQQALLKSEEHVSKHLPSHFVVFRPKDVVSGDFYWMLEKENHMYMCVADCTGHGVPGAFLTMLGSSFLNEINAGEKLLEPGIILDKLRQRFIDELSQSNEYGDIRDGMDISFCRLDLKTNDLQWAGANNPLYIIREGEILETRGDRQPIGIYDKMSPFTNHTFELKSKDTICIFSDGFIDQFGGVKGKKLKSNAFKKLLLHNNSKSMEEQKTELIKYFDNWKGNFEQIDDVCIVALRI